MQHNTHNKNFKFIKDPFVFNINSCKEDLQYCLGGTLYMPGTKNIVSKILNKDIAHMKSMVMCFEDAIQESQLSDAQVNAKFTLQEIANALSNNLLEINDIPLIFLRVRNLDQFISFSEGLTQDQAKVLSGFVFPKFYTENATKYFERLLHLNKKFSTNLYGMPILEGKSIAYRETRALELEKLKAILDIYKEYVLNIRIGGTDFSSLFGVRRGINTSIYDILPVRNTISDILNFFSRIENMYTISGPVWEYFLAYNDDDIKEYINRDSDLSFITDEVIVNQAIDGLLKEIVKDNVNGMIGKTVIHPSHLRFVNAMQAITNEEYEDALQIINTEGGVIKSEKGNKMNEIGPHTAWAERILIRSKVYGVIKDENDYFGLF